MTTFLTTQPIPPGFFARADATQVVWLGMAGVLVNAHGTILLIDPLLSPVERDGKFYCEGEFEMLVPLPVEARAIPRVDLVLYTHADADHLGRATAAALAERLDCRFLAPRRVIPLLTEIGVPAGRIALARDFEKIQVGSVEIEITPALHDYPQEIPFERGDCVGYLLRTPGGVIWHPGDTSLIPELFAIKGVDVFFFDIFAVETHLGSAGSARLAASCGAKVMVAYHYGTLVFPPEFPVFDPEDARPYLRDLSARYLILNPGEPLDLP